MRTERTIANPLTCDVCGAAAGADIERLFARVGVGRLERETRSGWRSEEYTFARERNEFVLRVEHDPAVRHYSVSDVPEA